MAWRPLVAEVFGRFLPNRVVAGMLGRGRPGRRRRAAAGVARDRSTVGPPPTSVETTRASCRSPTGPRSRASWRHYEAMSARLCWSPCSHSLVAAGPGRGADRRPAQAAARRCRGHVPSTGSLGDVKIGQGLKEALQVGTAERGEPDRAHRRLLQERGDQDPDAGEAEDRRARAAHGGLRSPARRAGAQHEPGGRAGRARRQDHLLGRHRRR